MSCGTSRTRRRLGAGAARTVAEPHSCVSSRPETRLTTPRWTRPRARGATCAAFHEAEVKKKAIALARESYLVADSSKIGKLQRAFFAPLGAFKAIITEHGEAPADEA